MKALASNMEDGVRVGWLAGLLVLAALVPAAGQGRAVPDVDCRKPQGTPEISYCAERDFERADARLNAAYRAMLGRVDTGTDFDAKAKASLKAAIQDAQRKWIAFRDADCREAIGQEWGSGTGGPYAVYTCMTEKTLARTKELESRPH